MAILEHGTYEKDGTVYKTLTLRDKNYALTCTPERGGTICSFQKDGEEYIWLRDGNFESTDRLRCGIPILFPCCGQPDQGVHHFDGNAFPMQVHGFACLLPWTVEQATDREIVLSLKANGLTKFLYPFDFLLKQSYALRGNTAVFVLTVENCSQVPMPYSIGYHPYFSTSSLDNVSFEISADNVSDARDGSDPIRGKVTLPHAESGDDRCRYLRGVRSPMILHDSGNQHTVTVRFEEARFPNAVLWEQEGEPFVCMEPWNGWFNSVNEEGNHEILNPGETRSYSWSITID